MSAEGPQHHLSAGAGADTDTTEPPAAAPSPPHSIVGEPGEGALPGMSIPSADRLRLRRPAQDTELDGSTDAPEFDVLARTSLNMHYEAVLLRLAQQREIRSRRTPEPFRLSLEPIPEEPEPPLVLPCCPFVTRPAVLSG